MGKQPNRFFRKNSLKIMALEALKLNDFDLDRE
jgi:hypothetical protein